MMGKQGTLSNDSLKSIVPPEFSGEFREWARDGGYDESQFNRWDSKSRALEEAFMLELVERGEE